MDLMRASSYFLCNCNVTNRNNVVLFSFRLQDLPDLTDSLDQIVSINFILVITIY